MQFLRYEEVPAHIAQKLVDAAKKEKEAVPAVDRAGAVAARGIATLELMRITRASLDRSCAICERTLLMGERAPRFAPNGGVRVRRRLPALPGDGAEYGWVKEGAPTTPTVRAERRRRGLARRALRTRRHAAEPVAPSRSCAASPSPSSAIVEAADLFNASPYRRTVAGIGEEPRRRRSVSIVAALGRHADVVVTIAWEISWYQYRVSPDAPQPVRLAERGHDPGARRTFATGTRTSRTTAGSSRTSRACDLRGRDELVQGDLIYCVIPRELADELYDQLVSYYADNPNVTVIVERRRGRTGAAARTAITASGGTRDRRRAARPGHVPADRRPELTAVRPPPATGDFARVGG